MTDEWGGDSASGKPSGEGPANVESRDGVRARLVDLRRSASRRLDELQRGFDAIVEAATDVATDDEHDPEGHTIAWERQQLAALVASTRTELACVERAMEQLDRGRYGICATCVRPIAADRLDALPATASCLDCARRSGW